jgi:hypothetical protein
VALLTFVGCSLLNRTGPDVTCADLQEGAINACSDGIIATCANGVVTWNVCQDSAACTEAWQYPNDFRCNQTDIIPLLTASSATAGLIRVEDHSSPPLSRADHTKLSQPRPEN